MGDKLLLIGGGGHCHSVADTILNLAIYKEIGIIDTVNHEYLGLKTVGNDDDLPKLHKEGWTDAFITVGSVGNANIRNRLYSMVNSLGFNIPVIIDPTAIIANDATLMEGTFIGKQAIINSGTSVEKCAIINSGSIIEHDCKIGSFSHISPGAILCGEVTIGSHTHIGAGSIIKQQIKIGNNVLIGIGSVVTKDFPDNITAYGNPCRITKK